MWEGESLNTSGFRQFGGVVRVEGGGVVDCRRPGVHHVNMRAWLLVY